MRDFASLFKGRDDAHGQYSSLAGRKRTDRGKLVSKAKSVHEAVTPQLWKDHLSGKSRLGIIPVMRDGKTNWICIDLDFYKIGKQTLAETGGYKKIADAIRDTGLPLVMTASKSGGAHIWCFLEEPIPAKDALKIAQGFAKKLNLASVLGLNAKELEEHTDFFPANASPDDIGVWVNLPYFGGACHCLGEDGESDLTLPEFVEYANSNLATMADLSFKSKEKAKAKGPTSDAPPCIDYMREHGVPEGHRNDAVTQFAIYALKAFPDTWEEETREFNDEHCDPPLRHDEVTPIIKSVGLKKYEGYMCKAMQSIFCNKTECKKRAFGVGKEPIGDLGIEHMEKIDGEEPIYLVTMESKTFACNIETLYQYTLFRRCVMGAINRLIPNMKQPEWEDILADHLEMMEVTEAAADTQMRDRVIKQFQNWCGQSCVTDSLDAAMEANCPFYDGKTIIFSGDALLSQFDRQLRITRDQAYVYMRGWGTSMIEKQVKGRKTHLWCWVQKGPLWFDPYKGKKQ